MASKPSLALATVIAAFTLVGTRLVLAGAAGEAPTGFNNLTNGSVSQAEFDAARRKFEERETIAGGLGPMYNADSCVTCHANPVTGGGSQITEVRAGRLDAFGQFVPATGGSLIHDRAISAAVQRHVSDADDVRGLRVSPSVLGLGYVEAIDDATLAALADRQALSSGGRVAGRIAEAPVLEAPGLTRIGRFGWKSQHSSLLSFIAEAYRNEMGITNRLVPREMESPEANVWAFDAVLDPEDSPGKLVGEQDIDLLTTFVRATAAPPPDAALAATPDARIGAALFRSIGCAACHVTTLVTASAGTVINGGTFAVPAALGGKIIHPYSDFLLHDVGTGDGIPQGSVSGAVFRTPPLWGLRTRSRLMHDGVSATPLGAVLRHRGEALDAQRTVRGLSPELLQRLLTFLRSL